MPGNKSALNSKDRLGRRLKEIRSYFSADFYQAAPVITLCASLGAVPLIAISRRHPSTRGVLDLCRGRAQIQYELLLLAGWILDFGHVVEVT